MLRDEIEHLPLGFRNMQFTDNRTIRVNVLHDATTITEDVVSLMLNKAHEIRDAEEAFRNTR